MPSNSKPTPTAAPKNVAPAPSFEAALGELEGIVTAMESGQMPLQEALDAYKRGVGLLRQCQDTLSAAEQQISVLDASGLHSFDSDADTGKND